MRPSTARTALDTILGVARSLRQYHGTPGRARAMDALYRQWIPQGGLAFDIGAHVGDRVASFRRLGARVVAVEPQPALARTLRLMFRRDARVIVHQAAVGACVGEITLYLNPRNPTVATASTAFIDAAADSPGWREQRWSGSCRVPQLTLDTLIRRHGRPDFVKIDVEGFEAQVLEGLSSPLPALSFEFTTLQREVALHCLDRCQALAPTYAFNAALGESQRLVHDDWVDAGAMARWIEGLPHEANSGDVYARLGPSARDEA